MDQMGALGGLHGVCSAHYSPVCPLLTTDPSLFIMNFSMIFAAASAGVYDPYTTSRFNGHSLIATASIIHGIVRIVGYPLLAKVADVRHLLKFYGTLH